jgi:hypothetical protein
MSLRTKCEKNFEIISSQRQEATGGSAVLVLFTPLTMVDP